jgi:hypothetical protein
MKRTQLNHGQASRIMYVELKSGYSDNGPAWIARVTFSKTGKSIYLHGKRLERSRGQAIAGNYIDVATGNEYWVSGIKKRGRNRHWAGSGSVKIDAAARDEYMALIKSMRA